MNEDSKFVVSYVPADGVEIVLLFGGYSDEKLRIAYAFEEFRYW